MSKKEETVKDIKSVKIDTREECRPLPFALRRPPSRPKPDTPRAKPPATTRTD